MDLACDKQTWQWDYVWVYSLENNLYVNRWIVYLYHVCLPEVFQETCIIPRNFLAEEHIET